MTASKSYLRELLARAEGHVGRGYDPTDPVDVLNSWLDDHAEAIADLIDFVQNVADGKAPDSWEPRAGQWEESAKELLARFEHQGKNDPS